MAKTLVLTESVLSELQRGALSKVEAQVLWHLVTILPPGGQAVNHGDIVKSLSISAKWAQQSMSKLAESGFLIRGPKIGLSYQRGLRDVSSKRLSCWTTGSVWSLML